MDVKKLTDTKETSSHIIFIDVNEVTWIIGKATNSELEDAKLAGQYISELQKGKVGPMIIDFAKGKTASKEARDYYAKDPFFTSLYSAVALVTNSNITRILANFYFGLNKTIKPTKIFNDLDSAYYWLKQYFPNRT